MSWDCRPPAAAKPPPAGGEGGGGAAGRGAGPRWAWNFGTSLIAVQLSMPATNTSVFASMLPFLMLLRISSSVTGPTCWPPMAMYHCAFEDIVLLRWFAGEGPAVYSAG